MSILKYGKYIDIFGWKNVSSTSHIFAAKNINVFAVFQDRNFNVTLANNFVKLNDVWTTALVCKKIRSS